LGLRRVGHRHRRLAGCARVMLHRRRRHRWRGGSHAGCWWRSGHRCRSRG
jgi:hypothetical protein